ncbi:MAG: xanthine dehydrogenase family protein molybdopterin-binding subunit, partial [Pseudomonadota bacterium]
MSSSSLPKFGMGASLTRIEDATLLTGRGRYADDAAALSDALVVVFVRSPHAHARIQGIDTSMARALPGVHKIYTADDVAALADLKCLAPVPQTSGEPVVQRPIPTLCRDRVLHVGDAVAMVVADSVNLAKRAAESVFVEYEPLEVCADTASALDPDAELVYPDAGSNLAFESLLGDREKTDAAFATAARVSEVTLVNNRLICNYMEPRACLAQFDADSGQYTIEVPSQGVHGIRDTLVQLMGVESSAIRVKTGDVGGGFGTKAFCYREYPLCLHAARDLGRSIRWTCERTEHFVQDAHGRDNLVTARMAMDDEGRFLALDVDLIAAMGSYLHCFGPFIPYLGVSMSTGIYDIPALAANVRGVYTHTTPTDAYRGAGRPEATYVLERLVDACARDLDLTPDEIRSRNMIRVDQMPYMTAGGRLYDTGEFREHMALAMAHADWGGFDARARESESRGCIRGIGMATYIEACAFAGSEAAHLTLDLDGRFSLRIGTQSNGQGHATAYAQIAAEALGVDYEDIIVRQGDTNELARGGGTGGSRSVPLGGASTQVAAKELHTIIKRLAADELEASEADIEMRERRACIIGTDKGIDLAKLAQAVPDEAARTAIGDVEQAEATYPNGTHICELEVDPSTGITRLIRWTA